MNTNTETEPSVPQIILSQINALDFWARARWGVKQSLADGNTLHMNCTRGNKILITLDASDTYTVKIGKVSRSTFEFRTIEECSDIYAEDLVRITDSLFSKAFGAS
jgi:hypothetical protein